jgi:hypothetical protein
MNNDYLGLLYQVINLEVISLGDGQWHCIRDFRRDSPTDRSDAGNSNGGTRQDMRENGTATHCSHEFSPCPNVFERCRRHYICRVKSHGSLATLQVIQHLLYRGTSNLHSSKFKSPCRSIGGFIRKRQGFFLSTPAQDIGIIGTQIAFGSFPIAGSASTPTCGLIAYDGGKRRAVSPSSSSP